MYISKLIHTIETYDPYGIHRLNGVKVVYVLLILFTFNAFFDIQNVYFYFFYAPITAMNAEVIGFHVKNKYKLFIATLSGACLMIFLFNILKDYPFIFLLFGFVGTLTLYHVILKRYKSMLILVPLILSLSAYSLLYPDANVDFYSTFNNAITTLIAMGIMTAALILFPLSYYYRLWLRALALITAEMLDNFIRLQKGESLQARAVQVHRLNLVNFSQMLPRHLPIYSILKINILVNQLNLLSSVANHEIITIKNVNLDRIIQHLQLLLESIRTEKPCKIIENSHPSLFKIIHSWNYLCSQQ